MVQTRGEAQDPQRFYGKALVQTGEGWLV